MLVRFPWSSDRRLAPSHTRHSNRRRERSTAVGGHGRWRLGAEALEDRRLLAVFTVESLGNSGPDTLRDAIAQANALPGHDTVAFNPALAGNTISISSTAIEISDSVDIQGLGADQLAVDGTDSTRIFVVDDTRTSTVIDVLIQGLTLQNGQSTLVGGAVFSLENLTVADSVVTGNSAREGGGIGQGDGALVLRNSAVLNNHATLFGGGVSSHLYPGAELRISNSTISGNTADADSGGLDLYNNGGTALIEHSTIVLNQADGDMSGTGFGGGIGIFFGSVQVDHTIVALNQSNAGGEDDIFGFANARYSLIGDNTGSGLVPAPVGTPDANGNLIGIAAAPIDPQIGALGLTGGSTPSHGLLLGSPARDAGDPAFVGSPFFDQRGIPYDRVFDGRIDMGAQENQPIAPLDGDFDHDGDYDCQDIDALTAAVAAGMFDLLFDIYPDGVLDLADRDAWLAEAGEVNLGFGKTYLIGDATLNGNVDGLDFIEWNNQKYTEVAAWCQGDFTMDGIVDGLDFIEWNSNKFTSSDAIGRSNEAIAESSALFGTPSDTPKHHRDTVRLAPGHADYLHHAADTYRLPAQAPSATIPRVFAKIGADGSDRSSDVRVRQRMHFLDRFFAELR